MPRGAPSVRTRLLAVCPVPVTGDRNGFSLRVFHLLQELSRDWQILLVAPRGGGEEAAGLLEVEWVCAPPAKVWTSAPFDDSDHPLRTVTERAIAAFRPEGALLWAGAEFLAFSDRFPPAVADRIDCMTLISWRKARRANGAKERARVLREALGYARYERRVVRRVARTVVAGEDDAAALRRIGGTDSVHVIGNGVELPPDEEVDAEAATPTVVFSGTMNYPPNEDAARFFTDGVWPRVLERVPAARFVIAGRSPSREVSALGARPGVEILPDVPDMRAVLRSAWVAVAPMLTGAGIKNKVLEAWAVRTPVVMTPLAANGLHLDRDAEGLVGDRPEQLADLLVRLLVDAPERRRLGMAGRELAAREHSWRDAGERLSAILDGAFSMVRRRRRADAIRW